MIIHAKGPANFAEKYIIHSIWEGLYPPGTVLPSERELSDKIGVTRTTLREVLQRLARDGWLTIQHGKPTKVNNFWETSGLNILETITELDQKGAPKLIEHLLAARKHIGMIYFKKAIIHNRQAAIEFIENIQFSDDALEFAQADYALHHKMAYLSNNPIYVLILNGFQKLYFRAGRYFFENPKARQVTAQFYTNYLELARENDANQVPRLIKDYSIQITPLWDELRSKIPLKEFSESIAS